MTVSQVQLTPTIEPVQYSEFWPKKIHFKAKMYLFLDIILINFLVQPIMYRKCNFEFVMQMKILKNLKIRIPYFRE